MIMGIEGGIRMPRVPPAARVPIRLACGDHDAMVKIGPTFALEEVVRDCLAA
jgi:hypothetical protein